MFLGGSKSSNHKENVNSNSRTDLSKARRRRRRRYRRSKGNRKKNRNRNASLQLEGDESEYEDFEYDLPSDYEYDDCDEECDSSCAATASSQHQQVRHTKTRSSPLPWTDEIHQTFVKAVLEIGIEESSPAVIAEQMITKNNYNTFPEDGDDDEQEDGPTSSSSPSNKSSAITTAAALVSIGENENDTALPEEAAYYKRELTGERLKSHLQKLRKQRDRETQIFLKDYQKSLHRKQVQERAQTQVLEREKRQHEQARRRRLKRKRSQQKPSTLLDASAFDHLDEFGKMMVLITEEARKDGQEDHTVVAAAAAAANSEDVTREEEERLLSMYLPMRTAGRNTSSVVQEEGLEDSDCELVFDNEKKPRSVFPVGGRAIGMLTWAVQQQMMDDRKKRKHRQNKRRKHKKRQQQQQQEAALGQQQDQQVEQQPLSRPSEKPIHGPNGWETASVDSWTSHTAIAAGRVATALGHSRRGPSVDRPSPANAGSTDIPPPRIVVDCGSSEEDATDFGSDGDDESSRNDYDSHNDDDDEFDPFRVSIPTLTKAEMNSPLGVSLRLTWDMIQHMHGVITEDRASKIQEEELRKREQQQQRQQQQGEKQRAQELFLAQQQPKKSTFEGSSSCTAVKETPPPKALTKPTELPWKNPETERMAPPNATHLGNRLDGANYYLHPATLSAAAAAAAATAAVAIGGQSAFDTPFLPPHCGWNPLTQQPPNHSTSMGNLNASTHAKTNTAATTSNSHLLAAMVANGPPPASLVETLTGAVLEQLVGKQPPSVVTPPSLLAGAGNMMRAEGGGTLKLPFPPMPPPPQALAFAGAAAGGLPILRHNQNTTTNNKSSRDGLQTAFQFSIPQSRSQSPAPSLSIPTTPTEAMFCSSLLLQQQQQQQQQQQGKEEV